MKNDQIDVFRALSPHLNRFPNIDVAASWLKFISDPERARMIDQNSSFKNGLLKSIPLIPTLDVNGKLVEPGSIITFVNIAMENPEQKEKLIEAIQKVEEEDPEQFRNFMIMIRQHKPEIVFKLSDHPPELPINFTLGVVESMNKMVKMTLHIYNEIRNKLKTRDQLYPCRDYISLVQNNIKYKNIESYDKLYGPCFYIAQIKFDKIELEIEDVENLLRYYCIIDHEEGIMTCIDHVIQVNYHIYGFLEKFHFFASFSDLSYHRGRIYSPPSFLPFKVNRLLFRPNRI